MGSKDTASTVGRGLVPLAAGAALVIIATGLARRRTPANPRLTAHEAPPPVTPPAIDDLPVPREPSTPATAIRDERRRSGSRLGPIMVAVALVLSGLGIGLVGVAVASQRRVPVPPATTPAASPTEELATIDGAWGWELSAQPSVALPSAPPDARPSPATTEVVLDRSRPVSLSIPAIGVQSVVNSVGQAADGSLETPEPGPHYNEAAWYRHSPTPGSLGPSILLGHVDSAADGPSVFFRLGELSAGDRVAVTRADTSVAVFRVDLVQRYAKDDFPTDTVYGNIDHAGLRIVTCGGAFDSSSGHYLDNVVVFASLADSPR